MSRRAKPMTAETKAQLMTDVIEKLITKWPNNPISAMEFALNFFTTNDLVGIRDELEGMK